MYLHFRKNRVFQFLRKFYIVLRRPMLIYSFIEVPTANSARGLGGGKHARRISFDGGVCDFLQMFRGKGAERSTESEAKMNQNRSKRVPKATKMEPKGNQNEPRGPTKDPLRKSIGF